MQEELEKLAAMLDSEIDSSDIPEWTEEDFRRAVRSAFAPRHAQELLLYLDDGSAAWVKSNARTSAHSINFALKQIVQHSRRAARERNEGSERPVYDKSSEAFQHGMELLSGRVQPDPNYVELPEYSDAELVSLEIGPQLTMKPYELTLFVDDEVAEWLKLSAATHTLRIRYALGHLARQEAARLSKQPLGKAT